MPVTGIWKGIWQGARDSCLQRAEGLLREKGRFNTQWHKAWPLLQGREEDDLGAHGRSRNLGGLGGRGGAGLGRDGNILARWKVRGETCLSFSSREKHTRSVTYVWHAVMKTHCFSKARRRETSLSLFLSLPPSLLPPLLSLPFSFSLSVSWSRFVCSLCLCLSPFLSLIYSS